MFLTINLLITIDFLHVYYYIVYCSILDGDCFRFEVLVQRLLTCEKEKFSKRQEIISKNATHDLNYNCRTINLPK